MEEKAIFKKPDIFTRPFAVLILGFAGGFFDAYTYVARGKVFCNAQTGNLILMTIGLAGGEGLNALRYLVPVAFFILANFVGEAVYRLAKRKARRKGMPDDTERFLYHCGILAAEILLLTVVGGIPVSFTTVLPNALISSVAALQYHAFRDMNGVPLSTVFCTNNLRLLSGHLFSAAADKDKVSLKKAGKYLLLIACFFCGVAAGYFLTDWAMQYAILFISALFAALLLWVLAIRRKEARSALNDKNAEETEKEVL